MSLEWLKGRGNMIRSFIYAISGIAATVKSERNMRKQKDGMSMKLETENVEENEVSAEFIW